MGLYKGTDVNKKRDETYEKAKASEAKRHERISKDVKKYIDSMKCKYVSSNYDEKIQSQKNEENSTKFIYKLEDSVKTIPEIHHNLYKFYLNPMSHNIPLLHKNYFYLQKIRKFSLYLDDQFVLKY